MYSNNGIELLTLVHDGSNTTSKTVTANGIELTTGSYYFIISGTSETGSYQIKASSQKALSISDS